MLIPTGLELEPSQAVEELGEVFLIPVQEKIEMGVRCDLGDKDSTSFSLRIVSSHKNTNFSQFELVIFGHDGVVVVVVEKHDMWSVFEAVVTVVDAFVLSCCDDMSVVGGDG